MKYLWLSGRTDFVLEMYKLLNIKIGAAGEGKMKFYVCETHGAR